MSSVVREVELVGGPLDGLTEKVCTDCKAVDILTIVGGELQLVCYEDRDDARSVKRDDGAFVERPRFWHRHTDDPEVRIVGWVVPP